MKNKNNIKFFDFVNMTFSTTFLNVVIFTNSEKIQMITTPREILISKRKEFQKYYNYKVHSFGVLFDNKLEVVIKEEE